MTIKEMIRQRALAAAIDTGFIQREASGKVNLIRFNYFWDQAEEYFGKRIGTEETARRVETIAAGMNYVNRTQDGRFDVEQIRRFCSEMEQTAYSIEELLNCTEG